MGYNNNIFNNTEFNILCCVILALAIISYLFLFGVDIFDLLHLNEKPGVGGTVLLKYKENKKKEESVDMGDDVPDGVTVHVDLPGNPDEIITEEAFNQTKKHGKFKKAAVSIFFTI